MDNPLVSIIINNYNYGRFLKAAIDSAIGQTYENKEIIIVDDGSTDDSTTIISHYGEVITAIFKDNGGQASAFNAGFDISNGDIIIFLDSDDLLSKSVVEQVVEEMRDNSVAKVHWPLFIIDDAGIQTGDIFPKEPLPQGYLRQQIIEGGPDSILSSPTSGNAWQRRFLKEIFPVPSNKFQISADLYLYMLAPLFGTIKALSDPQGSYRVHNANNFKGRQFNAEMFRDMETTFINASELLKSHLKRLEISVDTKKWLSTSWAYRMCVTWKDIKSLVSEGNDLLLVDDGQFGWSGNIEGRIIHPFIERDGGYWGPPDSSSFAIREIERQRRMGVSYMVFAWPSFWWLEHFKEMEKHLSQNFEYILKNDRLLIYKLY